MDAAKIGHRHLHAQQLCAHHGHRRHGQRLRQPQPAGRDVLPRHGGHGHGHARHRLDLHRLERGVQRQRRLQRDDGWGQERSPPPSRSTAMRSPRPPPARAAARSASTRRAGRISHGTVVTVTATPATGSTFTGWSGACSGSGACSVTMDAAKSVTATFDTTVRAGILALSAGDLPVDDGGSVRQKSQGGGCSCPSIHTGSGHPRPPGGRMPERTC